MAPLKHCLLAPFHYNLNVFTSNQRLIYLRGSQPFVTQSPFLIVKRFQRTTVRNKWWNNHYMIGKTILGRERISTHSTHPVLLLFWQTSASGGRTRLFGDCQMSPAHCWRNSWSRGYIQTNYTFNAPDHLIQTNSIWPTSAERWVILILNRFEQKHN